MGLRERKKQETTRALALAARQLVDERGLVDVTTEEIAAVANVSVRTFFNHFACKEQAVVGVDAGVLSELAEDLRGRPDDERPVDSLHAVLLAEVNADGWLRRWQLRNELVRRHPELLPHHLEAMVQVEQALADALADRLGADPGADPTPRVLVATALAVMRSTLAWWWEDSDRSIPLTDVLDGTFSQLVPDLPRNR